MSNGNVGIGSKWKPVNNADGGNPAALSCIDDVVGLTIPAGTNGRPNGAILSIEGDATNADQSKAIAFSFDGIAVGAGSAATLRARGLLLQNNEKLLINSVKQLEGFRAVSYEAGKTQSIRIQYFYNS